MEAYGLGGGLQNFEIRGSSKGFEAYKRGQSGHSGRNLNAACHLLSHRSDLVYADQRILVRAMWPECQPTLIRWNCIGSRYGDRRQDLVDDRKTRRSHSGRYNAAVRAELPGAISADVEAS